MAENQENAPYLATNSSPRWGIYPNPALGNL